MFIVIIEVELEPEDRHTDALPHMYFGPFKTDAEAIAWATEHCGSYIWRTNNLNAPETWEC
jgi:hypothetical protein